MGIEQDSWQPLNALWCTLLIGWWWHHYSPLSPPLFRVCLPLSLNFSLVFTSDSVLQKPHQSGGQKEQNLISSAKMIKMSSSLYIPFLSNLWMVFKCIYTPLTTVWQRGIIIGWFSHWQHWSLEQTGGPRLATQAKWWIDGGRAGGCLTEWVSQSGGSKPCLPPDPKTD